MGITLPEFRTTGRTVLIGVTFLVAFAAGVAAVPAGAATPRSKDDRGFSIVLVSPSDPYLTGRQTLRIEPIIPRGDAIEEVDFFVDSRLVLVAQSEPYACETDFGADLRRHLIEVRALTRQGRRAKVSFVSRSVDVTEGAAGPLATIPAVVRNASGRPMSLLGVSDFVLKEDGERRPIVHFASGSSPASIALLVDGHVEADHPEDALAIFLRDLPAHQSVTLVDGAAPPDGAEPRKGAAPRDDAEPRDDAPGGWLDPPVLAAALGSGTSGPGPDSLPDRLAAAARLLEKRRGLRVLLLMTAVERPPTAPPSEAAGPPAPPAAAGAVATATPPATAASDAAERDTAADEPLAEGLEAVLRARAVVYVVALGPGGARLPAAFSKVAERSGGQMLLAPDVAALAQALRTVAEALRNRYLLTFMPAEPLKTGWHTIDLEVRTTDLTVQAPKALVFP